MMYSNIFQGGRGGIDSFLSPLINKIGMTYQNQMREDLDQRLNDFKSQVGQLTTETFPEVSFESNMNVNPFIRPMQPKGTQVARPLLPPAQTTEYRPPNLFPMIPGGEELVKEQNELANAFRPNVFTQGGGGFASDFGRNPPSPFGKATNTAAMSSAFGIGNLFAGLR